MRCYWKNIRVYFLGTPEQYLPFLISFCPTKANRWWAQARKGVLYSLRYVAAFSNTMMTMIMKHVSSLVTSVKSDTSGDSWKGEAISAEGFFVFMSWIENVWLFSWKPWRSYWLCMKNDILTKKWSNAIISIHWVRSISSSKCSWVPVVWDEGSPSHSKGLSITYSSMRGRDQHHAPTVSICNGEAKGRRNE